MTTAVVIEVGWRLCGVVLFVTLTLYAVADLYLKKDTKT